MLLCVHPQCLFHVEGRPALHPVHLLCTCLPEAKPGALPESTGWTQQGGQVGSNNSFLTQAHSCTGDGEAGPLGANTQVSKQRTPPSDHCSMLHPVSSRDHKQIDFIAGGSSQPRGGNYHAITSLDISYCWRRVKYVGVWRGIHARTFLWAHARQLHSGKERMLGDVYLA